MISFKMFINNKIIRGQKNQIEAPDPKKKGGAEVLIYFLINYSDN